jgi:hypothetical protein
MGKEVTWTTKDGTRLRLSEMGDSHLRNAAAHLRRTASELSSAYWRAGCMIQSDAATHDWERQQETVDEECASKRALADAMDAELTKRGASHSTVEGQQSISQSGLTR